MGGGANTEEKKEAARAMRNFLAATWRGDAFAHHAEMMALTLEFPGREFGMFSVLPYRRNECGGNERYFFALLPRVCRFYRKGGMSGTLRAD